MSTGTDGTPPPSIAPRKPAGSTGVRTENPRPRPATGPVSGTTPPSSGGGRPSTSETTSRGGGVTDRLKRAAQGVTETARNAMPTRSGDVEVEQDEAPATRPSAEPAAAAGPRKVRLAVSRIDPWSVMKLSFLLSVAIGIMIVVSAAVIWQTLNSLEVFTQVNTTIAEITGSTSFFDLLEFVAFDRVISLAVMVAVVDIVLLTALSTIGAFLYNIVAALVGGIHLTLTDD
ncbi:DUF3566 domain-containing protein [Cellulomonas sp. APG4]|uniref:DUF3566 domain-containing protein n=1 Tax=Cellulomonas sp. APG4 TaxID=1538656 RepID=UPI00137A2396|nr:DUF3566 domain-containing protein [Cellulomonas sp. APG4]NCT91459.1 DUF3566 domain-containing protein [Cellulomonas sp. APG4]